MELSRRLEKIASYVPDQAVLADIGSDHALLPVYLVQNGKIAAAVAGELNDGPYLAARKQVDGTGTQDRISVRKGDGLSVLRRGEADTVVIAGMGGGLICSILEKGKTKLAGVRRLILQPNVGAPRVRRWLRENGWVLADEEIVEEDGKIYEILVASSAGDESELRRKDDLYGPLTLSCGKTVDESVLLEMGPWLLRKPSETFVRKWTRESDKLGKVLRNMEKARSPEVREKHKAFEKLYREIGEVLQCLQKVKP